jgi:hypothetical protein
LNSAREAVKIESERGEANESPLLEAVNREWLMKTQQAGKSLAGTVVICKVWRLTIEL